MSEKLQHLVNETIDLQLVTKQYHWNVRGETFKPVHEFLDTIYDTLVDAMDGIAERIVMLGQPATADLTDLVDKLHNQPPKSGFISTGDVAKDMSSRIEYLAKECLQVAENTDLVTQDLLLGIIHSLEKINWMLRAQFLSTQD